MKIEFSSKSIVIVLHWPRSETIATSPGMLVQVWEEGMGEVRNVSLKEEQ